MNRTELQRLVEILSISSSNVMLECRDTEYFTAAREVDDAIDDLLQMVTQDLQ